MCERNNLFEVSGEDINSPRQSFKNDMVLSEKFSRLVTATWALIGHELAGTERLEDGMFSSETRRWPKIPDQVAPLCRNRQAASPAGSIVMFGKEKYMAKTVLAFDFGASSGRAMLGSFQNGKIVFHEIHRFENNPVNLNGTLYWDFPLPVPAD